METIGNLKQLLQFMKKEPTDSTVDFTDLPIFGLETMSNSIGVWSWDFHYKIIGSNRDNFRIVKIADSEKTSQHLESFEV